VSETPQTEPEHPASAVPGPADGEVPVERPGAGVTNAETPAAGDPAATSTSPGIPSPATLPAMLVPAVVPDASTPSADPRVDDALSRLAEIDALPLSEQVGVYADIHRRLAGVLADPDSQA
jgi:hypothetical protein